MVKKVIINEGVYSGYRVNDRKDGLLKDHLDKLIDIVEKCYTKGRWSMVHLRYQPADGVSNSEFLEKLKRVFPDQVDGKRKIEGLRYVWVREVGKTKQPMLSGESGGEELEGLPHYHALIFINRHEYKKHFPSELHKLLNPDYVTAADSAKPKARRRKQHLQHFHCAQIDVTKTTPTLWNYIDKHNLLDESVKGIELKINSIDAVAYAVYWGSYLAKVETKYTNSDDQLVKLYAQGKGFGSTQLDKNWRVTEGYSGAKQKIAALNKARLCRVLQSEIKTAPSPSFPKSEIEVELSDFDWAEDDTFVDFNQFDTLTADGSSLPF